MRNFLSEGLALIFAGLFIGVFVGVIFLTIFPHTPHHSCDNLNCLSAKAELYGGKCDKCHKIERR